MIVFTADIRSAKARSTDAITTSSVGIPVTLALANDFDGLAKTVVFVNGTASADVAIVGDATSLTVPVDVLQATGQLHMGIYAADGDGTIVIPTVWAFCGTVLPGTVPSGVDPSAPTPSWVAQVQSIASEASENAETALNKATAVEEAAAQGDFDGADGVSPTVAVSNITGGHRVTITDADGSHVFDVMDGVDGTDGTDGEDGFSPTITVTDISGGHRLTITDVNGTQTVDVMDGTGGGGTSDYADLTNKPSINGVTLSGNKTAADLSLGTYSKPSGGIPKSDLASDVQTSLGKADTALQSAPVTSVNGQTGAVTVSVPSASSATPQALGTAAAGTSGDFSRADHVHAKPTYSKSDVGLGNVDNVQQYSASNPPPYPVTSVNGSTGAVSLSIPATAADVGAVASNQGSGNAGKWLKIDSDGSVIAASLPVYNGGVS